MTTKNYKTLFLALWTITLVIIPITLVRVTPLNTVTQYPATTVNFIQRLLGLTAFVLLFWQIIIGSYMTYWTEKLGGFMYKFHIFQGVSVYTLILFHPIMFVLFNYFVGKGIDPFYVFTQVCVYCKSPNELYLSFGRIAFWLVNVTVFAGLFRTLNPYLRRNWKKLHILNFLVFIFVGFHSIGVGTDIGTPPFTYFHGPSLVLVSLIGVSKFVKHYNVLRPVKNWLSKIFPPRQANSTKSS